MSTILDALKKAGTEQGHVRSPIAQGQLYEQTQLQQRAPSAPSGSGGVTTAVLAVGALIITATVFILVVVWVSGRSGTPGMATSPAQGQASASPAISPPPPSTPEPDGAALAVAPSQDLAPPSGAREQRGPSGLRYLDAQRLPVVPIAADLSAALPPPDPAESERDWSDVIDDEEIFEEEAEAEPEIAGPSHRIDGVIWDEVNPLAIVNGNIAGPGDRVDGAIVTRIESDRVILTIDGEEMTFRY